MSEFMAIFTVLVMTLICVVWIFLPFAVFGIKSRLDRIIKLQRDLIYAVQMGRRL